MSVFQTAGLMCADPGNAHKPGLGLADIKAMGYSFISPQGTNGTTKNTMAGTLFSSSVTMARYREMIREAGLKFVPWSKLYGGDIVDQAYAAAEMIHDLKPDGWILNPENEFKDDAAINGWYVTFLKARMAALGVSLGSLDWAVQPLGGPSLGKQSELGVSAWTYGYDMKPWLELPGCVCAPEEYWATGVDGADPGFSPLNSTVQYVERLGWPPDRIAHTFGWWSPAFASPEQYFANVDVTRTRVPGLSKGFMLYLADQASVDIVKRFAAGVAKGYALAAPPAPPPPQPTAPTPIQLRDQAKGLLDQALAIFRSQGKTEEQIRATRIYWADRILDPSSPIDKVDAALRQLFSP